MLPCGHSRWLLLCARPPLHETRIHLSTTVNDAVPCLKDIYCSEPSKHIFTRTTASRYYFPTAPYSTLLADPFYMPSTLDPDAILLACCGMLVVLQYALYATTHPRAATTAGAVPLAHTLLQPEPWIPLSYYTAILLSLSLSLSLSDLRMHVLSLLLNPSSPII